MKRFDVRKLGDKKIKSIIGIDEEVDKSIFTDSVIIIRRGIRFFLGVKKYAEDKMKSLAELVFGSDLFKGKRRATRGKSKYGVGKPQPASLRDKQRQRTLEAHEKGVHGNTAEKKYKGIDTKDWRGRQMRRDDIKRKNRDNLRRRKKK
jgi:curved DNA-binding protein CbpA